jgi:AP2-associated kinase
MVQKYEAINAKGVSVTSAPGPPPSPVKSVSSKAAQGPANGQKLLGDTEKVPKYQASSSGEGGNSARPAVATSDERLEPMSKQGKSSNRMSDKRKPSLTTTEINPRKLSVKAAPTIITSSNRTDPLAAARAAKSSVAQRDSPDISQISSSPRKRTMSIPSNAPPKTKDESHSPADNEAYHGVSKLIDQWQKKSAEAEQSRPSNSKRRSFTKRVSASNS